MKPWFFFFILITVTSVSAIVPNATFFATHAHELRGQGAGVNTVMNGDFPLIAAFNNSRTMLYALDPTFTTMRFVINLTPSFNVTDMKQAPDGLLYLVGYTTTSPIIYKLDQTGHNRSRKSFESTSIGQRFVSVAPYLENQIYALSNSHATRFNSSLDVQWNYTVRSGFSDLTMTGVTANSDGVYIAGSATSAVLGREGYIVRLSHNGVFRWNVSIFRLNMTSVGIAADSSGNIYVASVGAPSSFMAIASYTKDGVHRWNRTVSLSTGNHSSNGTNLVVDHHNRVYVTGSYTESSEDVDAFVLEYDTSGTLLWNTTYDSGTNAVRDNYDFVRGISLSRFGDILLTGVYNTTTNANNSFAAVFRRPDVDPGGCNATSSQIHTSTIVKSSLVAQPCLISSSIVNGSFINSSSLISAVVRNATLSNSLLIATDLTNVDARDSTLTSVNMSCVGLVFWGAQATGQFLLSGKVQYGDIFYPAPFNLQNICASPVPFSFSLTTTPNSIGIGGEVEVSVFTQSVLSSVLVDTLGMNGTTFTMQPQFQASTSISSSANTNFTQIAISEQGDVYVLAQGVGSSGRLALIKYNGTLTHQWTRYLQAQSSTTQTGSLAVTDKAYVFTHFFENGSNQDIGFARFDGDAAKNWTLWNNNTPELMVRGTVLSTGDVVLINSNSSAESWTMRIWDKEGNEKKVITQSNGTGAFISSVIADTFRNDSFFIAGGMGSISTQQPYVARYSSDGTLAWSSLLGTFGGASYVERLSLTRDGGLIALVRNMSGRDYYLEKRLRNGSVSWNVTHFFPDAVTLFGLAVDLQSDAIYVSRTNSSGMVIDRFASNGSYRASGTLASGTSYGTGPQSLAVDTAGNLYAAGGSSQNVLVTRFGIADSVILRDDGRFPDTVAGDGLWLGRFTSQSRAQEALTLYAKLIDGIGNRYPASSQIVSDNTRPTASLVINSNETSTQNRIVSLSSQYADVNGVSGCRFSNYNSTSLLFSHQFDKSAIASNDTSNAAPLLGIFNHNFSASISGYGLKFTGPSAHPLIYNNPVIRTKGSIEFWISPLSWGASGENFLLSTSWGALSGNRSQGLTIMRNGTNLLAIFTNKTRSDMSFLSAPISWASSSWHHVALTWDFSSTSAYLYIDGTLVDSETALTIFPLTHSANLTLGYGRGEDTNSSANATLDQLAIYAHMMSSQDVSNSYQTPAHMLWQSCAQSLTWQLLNGTANKTVWLQVKDVAGNIATASDTIGLIESVVGDLTEPDIISVTDDGNYTDSPSQLHVRLQASDQESDIFYRVRVANSTANITDWFSTANDGRDDEYTFYGLSLVENETYYILAQALNYNNQSIAARSDGIIVDLSDPSIPTINGSVSSSTWTSGQSAQIRLNGTDQISGVAAISYTLSPTSKLADNIPEVQNMTYPNPEALYVWNHSFDGTQGSSKERVSTIVASTSIYTLGVNFSSTGTYASCVAIKYNLTGTQLWNISLMHGNGASGSECFGATLDSSGNLIVAGATYTTQWIPFLLSLSSSGSINWQYNYTGMGYAFYDVKVDSSGYIVTGGKFFPAYGTSTTYAGSIAKFSSSGTLLWNRTYTTPNQNLSVRNIDVDTSGRIFVSLFHETTGVPSIFNALYGSSGNLLWNTSYSGGVNNATSGPVKVVDSSYISAGSTNRSGVDADLYLAAYAFDATHQWNTSVLRTNADNVSSIDSYYDLVITGKTDSTGVSLLDFIRKRGEHVGNFSIPAPGTKADTFVTFTDTGDLATAFTSTQSVGGNITTFFYDIYQSRLRANATIGFSDIADGQFEFTVSFLDFAGNLGPSSSFSLWIDSTAGSIPQFLSTDTSIGTANHTFSWTASVDTASGISSYHLRIDNNSDFSSPEQERSVGNVTSYTANLTSNGTWYASVRSQNGAGVNSSWSNTVSKIVDQIAPSVTVLFPPANGTVVTAEPSLRLRTNEAASCSFISGTSSFAFALSGSTYHETTIPPGLISDGTSPTIDFVCYDTIGNLGTADITFTIDTNVVITSITIVTPVNDAYINAPANVTVSVFAGASEVVGLQEQDFTLRVGNSPVDLGAYETSAGLYHLFFAAPSTKGNFTIVAGAGPVSDTDTLEVLPLRLYMRFGGQTPASSRATAHAIVYHNSTLSIGMAASSDEVLINGFNLGLLTEDTAFLFATTEQAKDYVEKKDLLLREKTLLDQPYPSFGHPDKPVHYTVIITTAFPRIKFLKTRTLVPGYYEALLANYGLIQLGSDAQKFNITLDIP